MKKPGAWRKQLLEEERSLVIQESGAMLRLQMARHHLEQLSIPFMLAKKEELDRWAKVQNLQCLLNCVREKLKG